jgi:polysaccharide export outer membrane protein
MKAFISPLMGALACLVLSILPATAQGPSDGDPHLKVNDTVRLEVYNEPDLSTSTKVLKSGEVVLPLVGTVKVAGLTVSKANEAIRDLYAKDYLVDPKLTLTIDEYSEEFISVIGAVVSPGQFPLPASGKLDLASALAMAGGVAPDANPSGILVTRSSGASTTHSAASVQGGSAVALRAGDRVTVQRSAYANKVAYIFGQVGKPGPVPFPPSGKLDLIDAIAQAGNYTQLASPKSVKINRNGKITTIDLKEMTEKGNTRYFLLPEDIVTVPERIW